MHYKELTYDMWATIKNEALVLQKEGTRWGKIVSLLRERHNVDLPPGHHLARLVRLDRPLPVKVKSKRTQKQIDAALRKTLGIPDTVGQGKTGAPKRTPVIDSNVKAEAEKQVEKGARKKVTPPANISPSKPRNIEETLTLQVESTNNAMVKMTLEVPKQQFFNFLMALFT